MTFKILGSDKEMDNDDVFKILSILKEHVACYIQTDLDFIDALAEASLEVFGDGPDQYNPRWSLILESLGCIDWINGVIYAPET